jgi:hypothetical protein
MATAANEKALYDALTATGIDVLADDPPYIEFYRDRSLAVAELSDR